MPYSKNWNDRLSEDPSRYGATPAAAARYAVLYAAYAEAVRTLTAERAQGTWAMSSRRRRDEARAAMLRELRCLYAFAQRSGTVSDAARVEVGVTVLKARRSRVARPSEQPAVEVVASEGRTVTVRAFDPTSASKRRRAHGASSAWIYSFVGDTPASDEGRWRFRGATAWGKLTVSLDAATPEGARVWFVAAWVNERCERGPLGVPVMTHLQIGAVQPSGAAVVKFAA